MNIRQFIEKLSEFPEETEVRIPIVVQGWPFEGNCKRVADGIILGEDMRIEYHPPTNFNHFKGGDEKVLDTVLKGLKPILFISAEVEDKEMIKKKFDDVNNLLYD